MPAKDDAADLARELEDLAQALRAVALERAQLKEHGAAVQKADEEIRGRIRELMQRVPAVRPPARALRAAEAMASSATARAPGNHDNAVAAMNKARRRYTDHPFVRWVVSSQWRTLGNWDKAHGFWRGASYNWLAKRRPISAEIRAQIETESAGAVPASAWD